MSNRMLFLLTPVLALGLGACGGASPSEGPADQGAANTAAPAQDTAAPNVAAPATAGIIVADVWARESPMATTMGAVYMRIDNSGTADDALTGASAAVAGTVEIHETKNEGGVMSMSKVDGIPVPAGGSAELKPGGYHVMLIGVTAPLKAGDRFPVTLQFANAGAITVEAEVRTE